MVKTECSWQNMNEGAQIGNPQMPRKVYGTYQKIKYWFFKWSNSGHENEGEKGPQPVWEEMMTSIRDRQIWRSIEVRILNLELVRKSEKIWAKCTNLKIDIDTGSIGLNNWTDYTRGLKRPPRTEFWRIHISRGTSVEKLAKNETETY